MKEIFSVVKKRTTGVSGEMLVVHSCPKCGYEWIIGVTVDSDMMWEDNCPSCYGEGADSLRYLNCTPHAINLWLNSGLQIELLPSGWLPRCKQERKVLIEGLVPINTCSFGEIEDLPELESGTYLICSAIVAQAAKEINRDDIVVPDDIERLNLWKPRMPFMKKS